MDNHALSFKYMSICGIVQECNNTCGLLHAKTNCKAVCKVFLFLYRLHYNRLHYRIFQFTHSVLLFWRQDHVWNGHLLSNCWFWRSFLEFATDYSSKESMTDSWILKWGTRSRASGWLRQRGNVRACSSVCSNGAKQSDNNSKKLIPLWPHATNVGRPVY